MYRLFFLIFILLFSSSLRAEVIPLKQAAVATAHPLATQAGIAILQQGGNAFDAAAAVTASLAVVEPYSSGIGGGAFWLIYRAEDGKQVMIDGREMAPLLAHKDMYLDQQGNVIKGLSLNGPMAAGIPGIPAGIDHLVSEYGRLSLPEVLKPAIEQAHDGFVVTERYQRLIGFRSKVMKQYPGAAAIFLLNKDNPQPGERIVQTDLADTLTAIAEQGRDGFYLGAVASKLVNSVKKHGGIWQLEDLANYKLVEREPIQFTYKDIKVTSAALPSSGGIVLGQALQMLDRFNLNQYDPVTRKHIVIEAMRRAYRDRAAYLGDSDFVDVPTARLLDKNYANGLGLTIDEARATPSAELSDVFADNPLGENTTHFSIIDSEGNRVSATLSINLPFGSGFVAEGTGVILNNEMDDFSVKPFTANSYGLIGQHANAIEAGKRPLSSMSPTFVEDDTRIGVFGTPGGSRIISMVLLGILDFAEGNLPDSWVSVPRYHHQYLPDQVQYEQGGLSSSEQSQLQRKGHTLSEKNRRYGNMQAVMLWKSRQIMFAASDPRGEGAAEVTYLP